MVSTIMKVEVAACRVSLVTGGDKESTSAIANCIHGHNYIYKLHCKN